MSTLTLENAKVGMKVRAKENWSNDCDYYFEEGNIYEVIEIDKDDEICPVKIDDCWFQPFELEIFEIVKGVYNSMKKKYLIRNFVTGEIYGGLNKDGYAYFDKDPYYYKKIDVEDIEYYLKECMGSSNYYDIFEVVEVYCND